MVAKRFREIGRAEDLAYSMVFAALIGGIVGAKLWYVAENGGKLFSGTGLVFYGGLIGGGVPGFAPGHYKEQPHPPPLRPGAPAPAPADADRPHRRPPSRRGGHGPHPDS